MEKEIVPVFEEQLVVDTESVKTGSVRVRKEIEQVDKTVAMPALRDIVSVNRIPLNQTVTAAPPPREEGDTLIISVVEEELVVQKRLVLKEEIHIKRSRVTERISKTVTLDREHAVVERLDADGKVVSQFENRIRT